METMARHEMGMTTATAIDLGDLRFIGHLVGRREGSGRRGVGSRTEAENNSAGEKGGSQKMAQGSSSGRVE